MLCRIYEVPDATLDQYDQADRMVGPEKPDGAHVHIAFRTDGGIRVIEVWDSSDAIDRYMEAGLGEALEQADLPEPQVSDFEVHKLDWVA